MGHPRWAWRHFLDEEEATLSWRWPASSRRSWRDTVSARWHTALQCFSKKDEGLTWESATSDTQSSLWDHLWTSAAAAGCTRASIAPAPGCPPLHPPRCCCPSSPSVGCHQGCRTWRRSSRKQRCRQGLSRSPQGCGSHEVPPSHWCFSLWAGWRCPDLSHCSLPTLQCLGWGGSSRRVRSHGLAGSGQSGLFHNSSSSRGCRTSTPGASSGGRRARLWG